MESFPLGPTPKIDFLSAQQQHTHQWLKRDKLSTITLQYNSLGTKEFNTEFLQFLSLRTSIYRLQVQMSGWLDKPRRRLDDRHKASGQTTVRLAFQNFTEILSCFEPRPNSVALSSGLSHFRRMQFPYWGFAHSDGWSDARNFHISSSLVRTMKNGVQTSEFWMRYLPYGWARPDGNPHRLDCCSDLPISVFWKEISITCRTLNGVQTVLSRRPDICTWMMDSSRTLNSV